MTIYEIELVYKAVGEIEDKPICKPSEMMAYMNNAFDWRRDQEQLWVVILNAANLPIGRHLVSLGAVDCAPVTAREVFRTACIQLARGIVLFHNHPSGSMKPSVEDVNVTKKLLEAGKILDIPVLDHLIYSGAGRTSSIRALHPHLFED
jgi:DNA repair protein RadC